MEESSSEATRGPADSLSPGSEAKPRARRGAPPKMHRSHWVKAAFNALAEGGVSNVRVEVLAARLGVTKGGFYGYFKDREALLLELLATWRRIHTQDVAQSIRETTASPRERLQMLINLSSSGSEDVPGGRVEQAIREWAATSEVPRSVVQQVDAERLEILTGLYRELGLSPARAGAYALLAYSYGIGSNTIYSTLGKKAIQTQREICEQLLTVPVG